jgi:uncharacterized protein
MDMNILENLFSSRVRARVLSAFFMSPGEGFYALSLAQRLDEHYNAVWKELVRLEKIGLLSSQSMGNAKVYHINPNCAIVPDLRSIVLKTEGVGQAIRLQLAGKEAIKAAFIYGSYATAEADVQSDLDLMIIGKVDLLQFAGLVSRLERELNRPINYVIFDQEEWRAKVENNDPYVLNVKQAAKIFLIGNEDDL